MVRQMVKAERVKKKLLNELHTDYLAAKKTIMHDLYKDYGSLPPSIVALIKPDKSDV